MSNPVKILITGDTYPGSGRVRDFVIKDNNVKQLFGVFLDKIRESDISITNLESPLVEDGQPIFKTGPNLKSPIESLKVLKNGGFNLLTLANNHIMDYGENGLFSTLKNCTSAHIATVGAGQDQEAAKKPFIREIRGVQLGIINIAENEFGTTNSNLPGAHALHPIKNFNQIKELSKIVDYVIVIIHGGHEKYPLPSPRMKETYRFFIDAGASAVVGHHPHCYSGYEVYKKAPIFYSLGNFLFDNNSSAYSSWNEGFMVEFEITGKMLDFDIIPYIQNAKKMGLQPLKKDEYLTFEEKMADLNDIISDDVQLKQKFEEFCELSRNLYSAYIEPHSFKYLHALRNRKLFPSLLSRRKKSLLLNLTRCEAHRDVLENILKE